MGEVETRELDVVGVLEGMRRTLVDVRADLARLFDAAILDLVPVKWAAGDYKDQAFKAPFAGVAIFNEHTADVFVGFDPGSGTSLKKTFTVGTKRYLVVPKRGSIVSVGAVAAGTVIVAPLMVALPISGGTY